jgi:hypothetical protein
MTPIAAWPIAVSVSKAESSAIALAANAPPNTARLPPVIVLTPCPEIARLVRNQIHLLTDVDFTLNRPLASLLGSLVGHNLGNVRGTDNGGQGPKHLTAIARITGVAIQFGGERCCSKYPGGNELPE